LYGFFIPDAGIMKTTERITLIVHNREHEPVATSVPLKVVNQSSQMQIVALLGARIPSKKRKLTLKKLLFTPWSGYFGHIFAQSSKFSGSGVEIATNHTESGSG
jgi:hypothetical protein